MLLSCFVEGKKNHHFRGSYSPGNPRQAKHRVNTKPKQTIQKIAYQLIFEHNNTSVQLKMMSKEMGLPGCCCFKLNDPPPLSPSFPTIKNILESKILPNAPKPGSYKIQINFFPSKQIVPYASPSLMS